MKKMRQRVLELSYYKSLGITTLDELEKILDDKRKKDKVYKRQA
jgi:hypothetical protein